MTNEHNRINLGKLKDVKGTDEGVELHSEIGLIVTFNPAGLGSEVPKAIRLGKSRQIVYRATHSGSSSRRIHKREDCDHLQRSGNYGPKPIEVFDPDDLDELKCLECW